MTCIPDTPPSAPRRRATTGSAREQLFTETAPMRRSVVWCKARWIPDAAAAVDAAVWEAIHNGATGWQTLYDVARYAAVAQRRYELRQRRRPPIAVHESSDPAERAVEITDAARTVRQLLSKVQAPSSDVRAWIDRKTGVMSLDGALPSRVKMAGTRWAARARGELEATDEVA